MSVVLSMHLINVYCFTMCRSCRFPCKKLLLAGPAKKTHTIDGAVCNRSLNCYVAASEETLGWKAGYSAVAGASRFPRRVPNCEKTYAFHSGRKKFVVKVFFSFFCKTNLLG